jgi:hypothetical protein
MKSSPSSGAFYSSGRHKFVRYGSLALGVGVIAARGSGQTNSTDGFKTLQETTSSSVVTRKPWVLER